MVVACEAEDADASCSLLHEDDALECMGCLESFLGSEVAGATTR